MKSINGKKQLPHSEKTKQKIRETMIGKPSPTKGKPSPKKGVPMSEEQKQKISKSLTRKKVWPL